MILIWMEQISHFRHSNADVTFQDGGTGQIVLSDGADLTIDTGSSGGNITIAPTIAGTVAGGTTSEDIILDAGTGNIELLNTGAAVIATDIGDVTFIATNYQSF